MDQQNGENDVVMRVWALLSEMSESLSANRTTSVNIHGLADGVKVGDYTGALPYRKAKLYTGSSDPFTNRLCVASVSAVLGGRHSTSLTVRQIQLRQVKRYDSKACS